LHLIGTRCAQVYEEQKKLSSAYDILRKGYKETDEDDLLLEHLSKLVSRQLAAENFPKLQRYKEGEPLIDRSSTPKHKADSKQLVYTDEVFTVKYPSTLSPLKKESAVIFHNAPQAELLHDDKGKYLSMFILRIPPKIHLNFEAEFWPGIEGELLKCDPKAPTGPCKLLGYQGRKIVADTKSELGIKCRLTMQVSAASPNGMSFRLYFVYSEGIIYLFDISASRFNDLCKVPEYVTQFLSSLALSEEGESLRTFISPIGQRTEQEPRPEDDEERTMSDKVLFWLGKEENHKKIQGWCQYLSMLVLAVFLYFFLA
jgi:hypothetical protein